MSEDARELLVCEVIPMACDHTAVCAALCKVEVIVQTKMQYEEIIGGMHRDCLKQHLNEKIDV